MKLLNWFNEFMNTIISVQEANLNHLLGVVHALVHQKLVKSNKITSFN
jgi:hypothetical protein